jgi:hypothetical protein
MASGTLIKVENLEKLLGKLDSDKLARRQVKKAIRLAAKAAKVHLLARARPISKRLARARVTIARDALSARVIPTASFANTMEKGRRAGAKAPPAGALKGGFLAARKVAQRGLPPRPFVAPAARDSAAEVQSILRDTAKEIEQAWRS